MSRNCIEEFEVILTRPQGLGHTLENCARSVCGKFVEKELRVHQVHCRRAHRLVRQFSRRVDELGVPEEARTPVFPFGILGACFGNREIVRR